ncbi:hypothetical protein KUTeg_015633 [Tegillarca granosa]|uniref:Uncharacterized protein n=1 Tax=Tegillarca granosa TaxID=220873 RepID=A0ABQ9EQQ1_TEGGR|nr:hypothetical protein KUTeg_015633 [Tegillarca granosa]
MLWSFHSGPLYIKQSISGTIAIDEQVHHKTDHFQKIDRQTRVKLQAIESTIHLFFINKVVANYFGRTKRLQFEPNVAIHWPNNRGPPPNKPICGFTGEEPVCPVIRLNTIEINDKFPVVGIVVIVFAVVLVVFGIIAVVVYRAYK